MSFDFVRRRRISRAREQVARNPQQATALGRRVADELRALAANGTIELESPVPWRFREFRMANVEYVSAKRGRPHYAIGADAPAETRQQLVAFGGDPVVLDAIPAGKQMKHYLTGYEQAREHYVESLATGLMFARSAPRRATRAQLRQASAIGQRSIRAIEGERALTRREAGGDDYKELAVQLLSGELMEACRRQGIPMDQSGLTSLQRDGLNSAAQLA